MQILVVWGLGGAGKSQLVRNYIQEYRKDYQAVFWIEAGSKATIERDYIQIFGLLYNRILGLGQETVKVQDAVPAIKRWFQSQTGRWLLVLDSADTIENEQDQSYINLPYFLPDAPGVHVIITSRSATAQEMTRLEAVAVGEMEPSEAVELFQRSTKMTKVKPDNRKEIDRVVEELGYLALAITLAGSYVAVTPRLSSDIARYLPEYRRRRKELLQRRPQQHVHRYGESVLSTWEASFDAITRQTPAAARLLSLLAFVSFEDISTCLFDKDGVNGRRSEAISLSSDTWQLFVFCRPNCDVLKLELDLESALETLQTYSLIQRRTDQRSYSMHKLVHAWGSDRLKVDEQQQLSILALDLMADATARRGISPSDQMRLVPHVVASFRAFSTLHESLSEVALGILSLIYRLDRFLYRIGKWSEAHKLRMFHFTKTEIMLGKESPETLTSMSYLAQVFSEQGDYTTAERMHREELALTERILGKEHPHTLTSMHSLAQVLSKQGDYTTAERMHREVLALRKTVSGKEHPYTLTSTSCLAQVLSKQGNYTTAERIHREVLVLRERVLGKEHPDTLMSMHSLEQVLSDQGDHSAA